MEERLIILLDSKSQFDGGLGIGGLKNRNLNIIAKWGWRYVNEPQAYRRKVIASIHGSDLFDWHTLGRSNFSLRSPWICISKAWKPVVMYAPFILGNGKRILFWHEPWLGP